MAGEYGERTTRPHYHALLFGVGFTNLKRVKENLFCSKELDELWPYGFSSIGTVTFDSAFYVAKYCLKKKKTTMIVERKTGEYITVEPEFGAMSLKPGLGYLWFSRYWKEVYATRDGCVQKGGTVLPPPKYYDDLLNDLHWQLFEEKQHERTELAQKFANERTPERLAVREICAIAKSNFHKERAL